MTDFADSTCFDLRRKPEHPEDPLLAAPAPLLIDSNPRSQRARLISPPCGISRDVGSPEGPDTAIKGLSPPVDIHRHEAHIIVELLGG